MFKQRKITLYIINEYVPTSLMSGRYRNYFYNETKLSSNCEGPIPFVPRKLFKTDSLSLFLASQRAPSYQHPSCSPSSIKNQLNTFVGSPNIATLKLGKPRQSPQKREKDIQKHNGSIIYMDKLSSTEETNKQQESLDSCQGITLHDDKKNKTISSPTQEQQSLSQESSAGIASYTFYLVGSDIALDLCFSLSRMMESMSESQDSASIRKQKGYKARNYLARISHTNRAMNHNSDYTITHAIMDK